MTSAFHLAPIARLLAERMLNCVVEGMVIGLFAWLLLQVVGRRNSSTRFAVWFAALLGIASLPLIQSAITSNSISRSAASAVTLPSSWAQYIFLAWALIAGLALARVGIGLWQLSKLRASCIAVDTATLDPVLQKTLADTQSLRPVALCRSNQLRVPTAIGFLKPIVVLPMWAMEELSTLELNSILIHELTHLRRHDDWTNLAQQILKALLFFHPAVWWIESKLALEREMACDDAVLAATGNPHSYAQCLVSIAEKTFLRRGLALAHAIVNRMRQTSLRVTRILDANHSSGTRVWKPALYSVAVAFVVSLVSFSHAPELVAFQNSADATSGVAVAEALPAHAMLASDASRFEKQPVATLASFHENSVGPASQPFEGRQTEASRKKIRRNTTPARKTLLAQQNSESVLHDEKTSAQNSASLMKANFHQLQAESFTPTVLMTFDEAPASPAFFVVMRTAQYEETGPMVYQISIWRITVVHLTQARNRRIPAKQI